MQPYAACATRKIYLKMLISLAYLFKHGIQGLDQTKKKKRERDRFIFLQE